MARRKPPGKPWRKTLKKIVRATRTKRFASLYLLSAIAILGLTTFYWSLIGAFIQSSNADQFANTFLLDNSKTLGGALLPSQHSFFIKIPLFWLISLFGAEPNLFVVATILLSLLTVGGLAYILWRIEKRPLVLGTLLLALAAVLLYIPAQSYPGSLLPANFAMVTTRNIEYLLFIGALILFLKARRIRSLLFISGCVAVVLLFASDRLFASLGVATAIIGGVVFALFKRRDLMRISVRLLIGMVIGYVCALLILFILERSGLNFDSGSALSPYGFIQGPKDLIIAIVYGVMGIFTNLGANPAYDATVITTIPLHILRGIVSPAGLGYIVTITIALVAIRATVIIIVRTIKLASPRKINPSWHTLLPVMLAATTVGALGLFIVSNHYYPADSRYLTIVLFTGFIAIAALYRKTQFKPQRLVRLGIFCLIAAIFGMIFQVQNLHSQNQVIEEVEHRNQIVAAALKSHPVSTLLGNYWRVLPIKLGSPTINVTPLESCTAPRKVLSTTAWQPDLHKTGFAYILRLDGGLADFPSCSLQQITDTYGRPDSSIVIAGTRAQPKELLLFFDNGIHFLKTQTQNNKPADTVTPISVDTMPFTTCPATTIMQFVAHEDDDILFMNPDLTHDIKAGNCIRTVFFTAGDAGSNELYWLGRQHGAEAAYDSILGKPNQSWTERIVSLDSSHTVTVANPRGDHTISLIFLHLPDGSPYGTGYASRHFESLRKLYTRAIPAVHSIDRSENTYTYGDLSTTLTHLMTVYKPHELRVQSTYSGNGTKDHSDHNAVGEFTTLAYRGYSETNPDTTLTYYLGYPVQDLPENITGEDYNQKVDAFLSFSKFDPATCRTLAICNANTVYGAYLARQYTYPY